MIHKHRCVALLVVAIGVVPAGCSPPGGGTSGSPSTAGAEAELEPLSLTLFTAKVELFMEYPPLVVGRKERFLAHLTELASGRPVTTGPLRLEVTAPDGTKEVISVAGPKRDGLFIPEPVFRSAGSWKARLVVESPQVQDVVELPDLVVHAGDADARKAAEAASAPESADVIPFLLEQQWKIEMLLAQATTKSLIKRLPVAGRIEAAPGASAFAGAPAAGRLAPPTGGRLPRIGDRVEAGQIIAVIQTPAAEIAAFRASRASVKSLEIDIAIRRFDLESKALEVDRSVAAARVRLDFARRNKERNAGLRVKGLSTQEEVDRADQDHELARAEETNALALKAACDEARRRFDELRAVASTEERAAAGDPITSSPVFAPIGGWIESVSRIEGEQVEAHAPICRILDHAVVWVVADVSEFDLPALPAAPGAIVALSGGSKKRWDITATEGGRFVGVGAVVDSETRTVPVRYEMRNPGGELRVGMAVEVLVEAGRADGKVAIPEEAIVVDNGRPLAFALLEGETFVRRELELGVRDGGWVEVRKGVAPGERVATRGAYAIKLVSAAPAAFGHGHAH